MADARTESEVRAPDTGPSAGGVGDNDANGDRIPVAGALVAILVGAAVLRLYGLGDDSLWDNEILSLQRATASPSDAYELIREGTHPPLFSQGVLRPWLVLGENEYLQRLPSAIFGVVTVGLTYLLGSRIFGRRVGLAAAALLTVLPLHVYYSREGRMYALLALLVTLWVGSLLRAHRTNSVGMWTIYTVLGAAILYTHYYAGLTVIAVVATTAAVYLWTSVDAARRKRWLVSSVAIGALFLPWLPTFWHQFRYSSSNLPGRPIDQLPSIVTQFFTAFIDVSVVVQALIAVALVVLAVPVVLLIWRLARDRDSTLVLGGVLVGAVAGTIVLAAILSVAKPILFVRYFAGILPLFCILLAVGAARARSRAVGYVAFGVLLVVSIASVIPILADSWRPDFAAAGERIAAGGSEGTVVILVGRDENDVGLSGFDYYHDADIPVELIDSRGADETVADKVASLDADIQRVWLVQYRTIADIEPPEGYEVTFEERYDSRFFSGSFPIQLILLEAPA